MTIDEMITALDSGMLPAGVPLVTVREAYDNRLIGDAEVQKIYEHSRKPIRYPDIVPTSFGITATIIRCRNCPQAEAIKTGEWEWIDTDNTVYYTGDSMITLQTFLAEHSHG